jgi:hypothetical protein
MATPNSLAIEILQNMEKSTDDAGFVQRVEKRVNDALDNIAITTNYNMFKTRSSFSTAAATAVYQLPAGGRDIEQLRYTDTGEPIWLWGTQEAARYMAKLEDSGRARVWIEDGILVSGVNVLYQFRLAPVPDSVLTVERTYYFHPSEVATSTVIPVMEQFIPLIRYYVKAELYELDGMLDRAKEQRNIYQNLVDKLEKRENRKIAATTQQRWNDLPSGGGRAQAIFDPSHFKNPFV